MIMIAVETTVASVVVRPTPSAPPFLQPDVARQERDRDTEERPLITSTTSSGAK